MFNSQEHQFISQSSLQLHPAFEDLASALFRNLAFVFVSHQTR
ncbi:MULTISPECIES: hypothetical protein [unclassified Calothrix]|nr:MULTISPECIES: hypothetical protein [unclassified Calothrix]